MSEGYNYDWTFWDALVQEQFKDQLEKLGKPKYRNFEVFKSPKGRWMAFHNDNYSDIKVVDLETLEVVATNFYSNAVYTDGKYDRDLSTYAQHTNTSTFVPSYMPHIWTHKDKIMRDLMDLTSLSENDRKDIKFDEIVSVPIAFNSWTFWAADFELYVDVLDLSKIDDGIIKKWDRVTSFIIPHEARHVRNYVKFNADYWIDTKPKEGEKGVFVPTGTNSAERGEYHVDFTILEERTRDRYSFNLNTNEATFGDMGKKDEEKYKVEPELPWQDAKRRMDEYKAGIKKD